jgi:predicted nuclease of predicted toxin-antitoxin system
MRFLLHGNLTPAAGDALRRHGHTANTAPELGIQDSDTAALLTLAHQKQLDILTPDQALANAPYEQGMPFNRSIVFLQLQGGDVEQDDPADNCHRSGLPRVWPTRYDPSH